MDNFSIGGAWLQGYRFIAPGFLVHALILILIGVAAPIGLQYALLGAPLGGASSPMAAGPAMMQMVDTPTVLLTMALTHLLQAGSYFASLRFGFGGARDAGGGVVFGLAGGFIATLLIAIAYLVAFFGARAVAGPDTLFIAVLVLMLPLMFVYSLFFIAAAIMAAATIIIILAFLLIYGAMMGYPELAAMAFAGSGFVTVLMLLLSGLLFWLAARFSCVMPLMAQRGNLNVFAAISESWRLTMDEQWPITRYLLLIGFGVAFLVIATSLAVGAGNGALMQGGGLGMDNTGSLVLGLVFGIPLALLSVMLPAGIYRRLVGEETPAEIFE